LWSGSPAPSGTTISLGGEQYVDYGGTASGMTISSGGVQVVDVRERCNIDWRLIARFDNHAAPILCIHFETVTVDAGRVVNNMRQQFIGAEQAMSSRIPIQIRYVFP
jgi:autotransporter passenger strand-loop-strand repeat protein